MIRTWRPFLLGAALVVAAAQAEEVDGLSMAYRSVTVSAPVDEILAEILVDEGDAVTKDQPLARLRDEKEQIEFRRFEKLYEKRQFDHQASQNLLKDNLMSKEKAMAAEAELELAKVDYDLAKTQLDEKSIESPLDGIVIRRLADEGEFVDRVQPIFEIVNIDQLYLQFYVEPSLARALKKGDKVAFHTAEDPDGVDREAIVDFISPAADSSSGLFRVKLLAQNQTREVLAGVRVTAEFLPVN